MKKISLVIVLLIIFLIGGFTAYKVIRMHNDNLILVTEKRIIEAAQKCWREDKCPNDIVTLKELYENNYLEQEINPLTKEIYSDASYVTKEENVYQFKAVD